MHFPDFEPSAEQALRLMEGVIAEVWGNKEIPSIVPIIVKDPLDGSIYQSRVAHLDGPLRIITEPVKGLPNTSFISCLTEQESLEYIDIVMETLSHVAILCNDTYYQSLVNNKSIEPVSSRGIETIFLRGPHTFKFFRANLWQ